MSAKPLTVIGAAISLFVAASAVADELSGIKLCVRVRFWNVPPISTKEVADWLVDDTRLKPVLLDVRTQAEYAVSHLRGAQWIDPDAQAADVLLRCSPDRPIVTYCAVGYRSAALAQRLIAAGRRNIYNMEGSIFQWANEGRALERNGKPVDTVHPCNENWGKLLNPRHRAQAPPAG
jgi:rhodanese-related sulfurtransferase